MVHHTPRGGSSSFLRDVHDEWGNSLGAGVRGKRTHDARLVAWMQIHDIERVLTFNERDFRGFGGLQTVSPATSPSGPT